MKRSGDRFSIFFFFFRGVCVMLFGGGGVMGLLITLRKRGEGVWGDLGPCGLGMSIPQGDLAPHNG